METMRKTDSRRGRIAYEVAGLSWLAEASDPGAAVVPVLDHGATWLEEPRLVSVSPTPRAAEEFGRALAHTHAAGASHLGAPPPGFDHDQPRLVEDAKNRHNNVGAARTHGDLWSGNVMWTPGSAVLIDPAAQGGHAEEDLAALAVFGCPHLERILAAYDEASPLADGWRERVALHQAHIMMIHCAVFGRAYVPDAVAIARRYA